MTMIFFFFFFLDLWETRKGDWWRREKQMGMIAEYFFSTKKCVSEHMCAHAHASTQMDRVSQKVETSRHICIFQLEHIED